MATVNLLVRLDRGAETKYWKTCLRRQSRQKLRNLENVKFSICQGEVKMLLGLKGEKISQKNSSTSEKVSEQCFVKSCPIWSSPPSSCFKTGEQKIIRNLLRQTQQINQGKLPSSQNISTKENLLNLLEAALVPNFWSNIFNCSAVNGGRTLFQKGRFAPMMLCWPPGRVTDAHSGWKESSFSSLRISRGGCFTLFLVLACQWICFGILHQWWPYFALPCEPLIRSWKPWKGLQDT